MVPVLSEITNCRDEADNKVLSLALDSECGHVLTGDADQLTLNPWCNIGVVSPAVFRNSNHTTREARKGVGWVRGFIEQQRQPQPDESNWELLVRPPNLIELRRGACLLAARLTAMEKGTPTWVAASGCYVL